jgi:3-dehydroquinate dehydratase I
VVEPSVTARSSAKGRLRPRVVGVITSHADLDFAIRMREPPDLFELRLDRLVRIVDQLEKKLPRMRPPLIITARHPQEGGANKLSLRQRRDLLSRFLTHADYLDVELRSVHALDSLLKLARKQNVRRIISVHYLKSTPPSRLLRARACVAKTHGADIFKLATRTDTPAQLARLLDFVTKKDVGIAVSAMGIGELGKISRVLLACCESALLYASLGESDIEGQISLQQLRALGIARRMTKHE